MDFKKTNDLVIAFFKQFHDTFVKVDAYFDELDDQGGADFSTAKRILELLQEYNYSVYCKSQLTDDSTDYFTDISFRLDSATNFCEYVAIVKDLQRSIHEFLVYETRWPGQSTCYTIINRILDIFCKTTDIPSSEENSFYACVRILRELVADCSISIRGLTPLAKWSYGTIAYSLLNANEQLVVLLNQCILTDRMYYCLQSLEITLDHLNKAVDGFEELDWNVYYTVGFLNFKIHRYSTAIRYFQCIMKKRCLKDSMSQNTRERYFHANLLVAYCYEYDHNFDQAICILATDPERIVSLLDIQPIETLSSNFSGIMDQIIKLEPTNEFALIPQYFSSYSEFEQVAQEHSKDNSLILGIQFEILHAFAHCLNEYSIKHRATTPINSQHNYGKCIRFARLIMSKIASIRPEYWTCYATIHGECKDYHVALLELDKAQSRLSRNKNGIAKESLIAEICFFRYYFNMLCNQASLSDRTAFEQYSEKYDDDDAKCYLKIFEFRDELRRHLSALYECIHNLEDDVPFTEASILPIPAELQSKYIDLCSLAPTLYMNASVRSELRLMQCAYNCIDYLRTYFIHPTPKNLLILQNACYRFSIIKQEFHQASISIQHTQSIPGDIFPCILPTVVKDVFATGISSILSSLYSTDSIFILAPISGVVVFQYQTGTIKELFDLTSILPVVSENETTCEDIDAIADSVIALYNTMSETIGLREMIGVDWSVLAKYTDVIYHWSNKVSSQVVVCENGKPSYVRQIVDDASFSKVISNMKDIHDQDKTRRYCNDNTIKQTNKTLKCTLQKVTLPWLEIVNEQISRDFFIAWNDEIESFHGRDTIMCFLIPLKTAVPKHNLHKCIRQIKVIYQQNNVDYSESELKTAQAVLSQNIADLSLLALKANELREAARSRRSQVEHRRSNLQTQLDAYGQNSSNPNIPPIKAALKEHDAELNNLDLIINYLAKRTNEISCENLQLCQSYLSSLR